MSFLSPYWLIPALALLLGFVVCKRPQQRDNWHRVIHEEILTFLRNHNPTKSRRVGALLLAAIAAVALANPSIPESNTDSFRHSEGWFVLLDVSRSMTLNDIVPSRLSAARDVATQLAARSDSRPLSLIIFAGDAFMITPPAFDTQHFIRNVALLEHGLVPVEGSNLTRALSLSTSVIESSQMLNARLFILTDTGGINSKSEAVVSQLTSRGHTTDLIVIGTENSSENAHFDLVAAQDMAEAGSGMAIEADLLGEVNLVKLKLNRVMDAKHSLVRSGIALLQWHSLSHWVLLPALLVLMSLFLRERT